MIICQIFDCFIIFSFVGWIYECGYCSFKEGHWRNRGFLYGPVCPIYGSGVVLARIAFYLLPPLSGADPYPAWEIFLVCAVGSAIMEFGTSWILEKCFHALWWDYSDMPFNIQGRICLPATCGFGIAGILVVKVLIPFMASLPIDEHPLANEILCIGFAIVFGMDLALTVASLTRILERMDQVETEFNSRMETGYRTLQHGPAVAYNKVKGVAISAGETAVIAAMLATDSAKEQVSRSGQEMSEKLRMIMGNFSVRDIYHLRSIRSYRPVIKKGGREDMSEILRKIFAALQRKAGEREVHDQERDEK